MKAAEEKFYSFIMDRTQENKKDDMKHLLAEMLERKGNNQLDKMYLMSVMPRALSYLNPDDVNEVKKIVSDFSANFK